MEVIGESDENGLEFRRSPHADCKYEAELIAFRISELVSNVDSVKFTIP
jgi:hypothetical protein